MSLTLGEKLRQAREERGFSLSEVAEQTRISSLYLESIENDDYRILPGGIFNKGFVKSYAKFVGINEQEALADYSQLISQAQPVQEEEQFKSYRPEVLTDDRSGSMAPTIILAVVILAVMTGGILFLVNYLRSPSEPTAAEQRPVQTTPVPEESATPIQPASDVPDMSAVKVDFKATSEAVAISALSDDKKTNTLLPAGGSISFEPKENLKISYSKSLANFVQLFINGKEIKLPSQPLVPKRVAIEVEINKENLASIWKSGAILPDTAAGEVANTAIPAGTDNSNTAQARPATTPAAAATPRMTPAARPATPANTSAANTNRTAPKPAVTPKATPAVTRPAGNRPPQ